MDVEHKLERKACLSDVGACHALVHDLTSGLLHTLGYCQKIFIDFQVMKIRSVENYYRQKFPDLQNLSHVN